MEIDVILEDPLYFAVDTEDRLLSPAVEGMASGTLPRTWLTPARFRFRWRAPR
jgi:hypothetical protein